VSPNIKIQRAGPAIRLIVSQLLSAADLERWKDDLANLSEA